MMELQTKTITLTNPSKLDDSLPGKLGGKGKATEDTAGENAEYKQRHARQRERCAH